MHDFRIVCSPRLDQVPVRGLKHVWWRNLIKSTYTSLSMQNTRYIVNYSHSWWTIIEPVWVANNIVLSFGLNLCLQKISHRPTIFALYLQFRASFKIIGFKSRDQKEEHRIKKQQIFQNPMAWCILLNKKTWQVHCSPLALLLLRILWSCCGCQLLGQAATVPDDEDDTIPETGKQSTRRCIPWRYIALFSGKNC